VWAKPGFVACATGLEAIASASVLSIQETHEFSRAIPMIIRGSERVIRDIPSWAEDQKVHQRMVGNLRLRGQHAEDGGVDVILRNAPDVHEFLQRVFIWYVAGVGVVNEQRRDVGADRNGDANFPCQATTSNGVWSCLQANSRPPSLRTISRCIWCIRPS